MYLPTEIETDTEIVKVQEQEKLLLTTDMEKILVNFAKL